MQVEQKFLSEIAMNNGVFIHVVNLEVISFCLYDIPFGGQYFQWRTSRSQESSRAILSLKS